jgi:hypothetical protein
MKSESHTIESVKDIPVFLFVSEGGKGTSPNQVMTFNKR